jgi:sulfur-carrier protein
MEITVKLFANLRQGRFEEKTVMYPDGMTIDDILSEIDVPKEKAALIFVNSINAQSDYVLKDKDVLAVFPPVGGG